MIHINEVVRKSFTLTPEYLRDYVRFSVSPEMYEAMSISDFSEGRIAMKGNTFLKSFVMSFFPYYPSTNKTSDAVVFFENVKYYSPAEARGEYIQLSDLSASMAVAIVDKNYHNKEILAQSIREGDKIQKAAILYNVITESGSLLYLRKIDHRPAAAKRAEGLESLLGGRIQEGI